jgi:hypothetical protein
MPDIDDATQSEWELNRFNCPHNYHSLEEKDWSICVYSNFYPRINIPEKKVLHLTPKLKQDLDDFMGEDLSEFGTPSIMSTSQAQGRSAERLVATHKILKIFPDHWGDGWHYISHPEISIILFDHEYTKALVAFRIVYEGGYACLRKNNYNWEFIDSIMYWIE